MGAGIYLSTQRVELFFITPYQMNPTIARYPIKTSQCVTPFFIFSNKTYLYQSIYQPDMANKELISELKIPSISFLNFLLICLILALIIACFSVLQKQITHNKYLNTHPREDPWSNRQLTPQTPSTDISFTVTGLVNGSPLPSATVYLYAVSNTGRAAVLAAIQNNMPFQETSINATNGFTFSCISPGYYATVMPGSSFDGPINGPVPHAWQRGGYALTVSLHGYDLKHQNLVVGFSIANIYEHGS
jgi:hypothetical protein